MLKAYLALAFAQIVVGSLVVVGKVIGATWPLSLAGAATSAIAVVALLPLLLVREGGVKRVAGRDLGALFLQAFFGIFLFRYCLFFGLQLTTAVEGGIITSTTPALLGLISFLFLHERPTWTKSIGIAMTVLGVLVINALGVAGEAERGPNPLLGNLLMFGVALFEALFTIFGKVASARVSPVGISVVSNFIALLLFLPFALVDLRGFDPASVPLAGWVSLLHFALGGSVIAFTLWFYAVSRVPGSTAAVFSGLMPVSAVVLSYALLGEPLLPSHALGGACVVVGILLIARPSRSIRHTARGGAR
jgi:drug/metabolite transporter (DMT)-like permease